MITSTKEWPRLTRNLCPTFVSCVSHSIPSTPGHRLPAARPLTSPSLLRSLVVNWSNCPVPFRYVIEDLDLQVSKSKLYSTLSSNSKPITLVASFFGV